MVGEKSGVKSIGVYICKTLKARLMFFLKKQVVGSCCSVVLVGHQALTCIFGIVAYLANFTYDIRIDWYRVLSNHNSLRRGVIVQSIEFVIPNLD
jgi:hypothetical protein